MSMDKLKTFNKFWVALGVTLAELAFMLEDGSLTGSEWALLGSSFIGAVGVWAVTNGPETNPKTSTPEPELTADAGFAEGGVIWTIVGVLAIIALVLYITGR